MKHITTIVVGLLLPMNAAAKSITDYWNCTGIPFCGKAATAPALLIGNIVGFVQVAIIPAAVIACIYGGFRMTLSQGSEGKDTGKKAITYAALGLIFAYLAIPILTYIASLIGLIA